MAKGKEKRTDKGKAPAYSVTLDAEGVFTLCFELEKENQCFTSLYAPSMDVRYKRHITPVSSPATSSHKGKPWDKGTYAITRMKTKEETEAAFTDRLKENKLSLVLNGDKLKGRFSIHKDDTGWHIYKHKDKYAKEEDPLSGELQRSISKWHISKEDIETRQLGQRKEASKRNTKQQKEKKAEEEITPLLTLNGKRFHFQFYKELDGEELICMVNATSDEPFVMKEKKRNQWQIITPVSEDIAEQEKQLASHAKKLLAKQHVDHQ